MALWKDQIGHTMLSFRETIGDDPFVLSLDELAPHDVREMALQNQVDILSDTLWRITIGNIFTFREVGYFRSLRDAIIGLNRIAQCENTRVAKRILDDIERQYPNPLVKKST